MKPNLQKSHTCSLSHLIKLYKTVLFAPAAAILNVSQLTEQPIE